MYIVRNLKMGKSERIHSHMASVQCLHEHVSEGSLICRKTIHLKAFDTYLTKNVFIKGKLNIKYPGFTRKINCMKL